MGRKTKEVIGFIIAIIIFYAILFSLGITCPIKAVMGVSCPGCGMSRAWLSFLRLKPGLAFDYHPLFPLPAIFALGYIFRDKLPRWFKKLGLVIIITLFFLVYLWRMKDPNDKVVVFRPKQSIVYQAYRGLGKRLRKR